MNPTHVYIVVGFVIFSLLILAVVELRNAASLKSKPKPCDHVFWPVCDYTGQPVGQRCAFCGHYNSLEDISKEKL